MAVEIAMQQYVFGTAAKEPTLGDFDLSLAKRKNRLKSTLSQGSNGLKQSFFHNPLHDAESIWWGCVELLFTRRVECSSMPELQQQYKEKYADLSAAASNIFPDGPSLGTRHEFLVDLLRHDEIMSHLPPSLTNISNILSMIRDYLVLCYVEAEQTDDGIIRAEVYELEEMSRFADFLVDARLLARGMKLTTFPKHAGFTEDSPLSEKVNITQRAGSKRKASESPDSSRKTKNHKDSTSKT
jgi:hypothetical protein